MKALFAILLMSASSICFAHFDDFYVQGNVGVSKLSVNGNALKDKDTSFGVSAGAKYHQFRYAVDVGTLGQIKSTDIRADRYEQLNISRASNNTTKFKVNTLGVSAFYDLPTNHAFTPYIGARVSYNDLKYNLAEVQTFTYASGASDSNTFYTNANKKRLGYGAVAGVQYQITPKLSADASLTHNRIGKFKWTQQDNQGEPLNIKTKQTGLTVGLRYHF